MKRKSQVEKFNAKFGKEKIDEQVIHAKPKKTIQQRGAEVATKQGMNPEEIFAVIGRESMDGFVKMWNNSMENVIKETIINELKPAIREIIREELILAFSGIAKGMASEEIVETEEDNFEDEIFEEEIFEREEMVEEEIPQPEPEYYSELRELIWLAKAKGIDPSVGKHFKDFSSRANGLYQKFTRDNRGVRGAWVQFVDQLLSID